VVNSLKDEGSWWGIAGRGWAFVDAIVRSTLRNIHQGGGDILQKKGADSREEVVSIRCSATYIYVKR
jgi:hypothetical protein